MQLSPTEVEAATTPGVPKNTGLLTLKKSEINKISSVKAQTQNSNESSSEDLSEKDDDIGELPDASSNNTMQ